MNAAILLDRNPLTNEFASLGELISGTYHKESSQCKMKKLKGMGIGYNFNVRY